MRIEAGIRQRLVYEFDDAPFHRQIDRQIFPVAGVAATDGGSEEHEESFFRGGNGLLWQLFENLVETEHIIGQQTGRRRRSRQYDPMKGLTRGEPLQLGT